MRCAIQRLTVSTSVRQQCRIRTEEEITECQTPPVGDPALHQMVRPIVQHVAALTEGPQIFSRLLRYEEKLGPAEIARRLGIGRASVYRVLAKKGAA